MASAEHASLPTHGPQPTPHPAPPATALRADVRCVLADRGLLAVHGADAARYLHGQLSTDVLAMAPGETTLTSWSDGRGRLLLVGRLHATSEGFLLEVPGDRLEPVRQQLTKFVLRAAVTIEDASGEWARFVVAGRDAVQALGEIAGSLPRHAGETTVLDSSMRLIALPGVRPRWQVLGEPEPVAGLWRQLAQHTTEIDSDGCALLDIEAGIPAIHAATAGRFVAQMLNLDRLGAIDFQKGCYPGQEVIARTHYLGRVKRRMQLFEVPRSGGPIAPGDAVHAGDTPAGEVVLAAPCSEHGHFVLAVTRQDANEAVAVGGGAAHRRALPYRIEDEAA